MELVVWSKKIGTEVCSRCPDWPLNRYLLITAWLAVSDRWIFVIPAERFADPCKHMAKEDTNSADAHGKPGDHYMQMNKDMVPIYFHFDFPPHNLFRTWSPQTTGEMVGAAIAFFILACTFEALSLGRRILHFSTDTKNRERQTTIARRIFLQHQLMFLKALSNINICFRFGEYFVGCIYCKLCCMGFISW